MRVLITGGAGFIGANLGVRLRERGGIEVEILTRGASAQSLSDAATRADFVYHLAGVNRPKDVAEFQTGNADFTEQLCRALAETGRRIPVVFASSTQATRDNAYGRSKLAAEQALQRHQEETESAVHLFRLTNVFGKWSRPNYNSAVATFCHNIARGLPITVNDPNAPLRLVYIDDVLDALLSTLDGALPAGFNEAGPVYDTTVGELASTVLGFADSRGSLVSDRVGTGLVRALYATYVSFLPPESFAYDVPKHSDPRGDFVEMLKTTDSGQFSYFTAHPGVTRGDHYHHTKTEKFLVIKGTAHFGFRHIETQARHELVTRGGEGRIVETIPGWTHNITNIGEDELVVMLWANEIFDRGRPDTIAMKVGRP